ncbi:MAG: LysM peptidoglycan-binding domain-containing protein [Cytophagales bacterium]|nr:LysM peptidoglycan-binding domain-containing protein [Cytophagales bacterium]
MHKVTAGETLFSISRLYDVSVDEIKAWNSLPSNSLSMGQELVIKKKSPVTETVSTTVAKPVGGVHTRCFKRNPILNSASV